MKDSLAINLPFTEKYRPKSLDEIIGNSKIVECLKSFTIQNMPNLLFYGPPGTGKTTSIKCLLANFNTKIPLLELNASDERGIGVVREKIKEFAATLSDSYIILDEVDFMSKDAQGALRRIIDDFSARTRFCLLCNYDKKIIDPIRSRCSKFRFLPVVDDNDRVRDICNKEKIEFDDEGLDELIKHSNGDFRKLLNDLEGIKNTHNLINVKNVNEFLGIVNKDKILEALEKLLDDKVDFMTVLEYFRGEDFDLESFIIQITEEIIKRSSSIINNKLEILNGLAEIEERLSIGCTDKAQMPALIQIFKSV